MRWPFLAAALALAVPAHASDLVEERSIAELSSLMASGKATSRGLVDAYLRRIARIDKAGPRLNSVIAINPHARAQAAALDAERRDGWLRGPLHGVPILVKDNIETRDAMPTTAGSLALRNNVTGRDAPLVARLRAAGAVILGKTNLSEWANIRSTRSTSGWSAVGGLTRNPYALDRNTCGSSSGSGAASAASLAAAAVGTETDGSITCPAAMNGLVGVKPTVGLISRTHVVPISHTQDTAGPMARSVRDAALLLAAMAGTDAADTATAPADARRADYVAALSPRALQGKRIGVLRFALGPSSDTIAIFDAALRTLELAGATLVDISAPPPERQAMRDAEQTVLTTELKADLDAYLATTKPAQVPTRTLASVIAFNRQHAAMELPWFGQQRFEASVTTTGLADPAYLRAKALAARLAGAEGIDAMLGKDRLDALVAPTTGPAWTTDLVNGDHVGGGGAGSYAAIAGYPHVTVPMGLVHDLPVGLSFIGSAWQEAEMLGIAFAFEQAAAARRKPRFLPTAASERQVLVPGL